MSLPLPYHNIHTRTLAHDTVTVVAGLGSCACYNGELSCDKGCFVGSVRMDEGEQVVRESGARSLFVTLKRVLSYQLVMPIDKRGSLPLLFSSTKNGRSSLSLTLFSPNKMRSATVRMTSGSARKATNAHYSQGRLSEQVRGTFYTNFGKKCPHAFKFFLKFSQKIHPEIETHFIRGKHW